MMDEDDDCPDEVTTTRTSPGYRPYLQCHKVRRTLVLLVVNLLVLTRDNPPLMTLFMPHIFVVVVINQVVFTSITVNRNHVLKKKHIVLTGFVYAGMFSGSNNV